MLKGSLKKENRNNRKERSHRNMQSRTVSRKKEGTGVNANERRNDVMK
jgi:hypothetical protein